MNLKEEKQITTQELIDIINEGLSDEEQLTSELLRELRDKIDEMILNDF